MPMGEIAIEPVGVLQERVARVLEIGRQASGMTVDEFVVSVSHLQGRRPESRSSWYRWLENPQGVTACTLLATLQSLGESRAMELLFGHAAIRDGEEVPAVGADVALLSQQRVRQAELRRDLAELRAHVGHLRSLQESVELMEAQLSDVRGRLGLEGEPQVSEPLALPQRDTATNGT